MMKAAALFATFLTVSCVFNSASAYSPGYASFECRNVPAESAEGKSDLAILFKTPGARVEKCIGRGFRTGEQFTHYYWKSPSVLTPLGVCRYESREVFRDTAGPDVRWQYHKPGSDQNPIIRYFVYNAEGGVCPPQDDNTYVRLLNVSDGVAKLTLERWKAILSSAEAFNKFISDIPEGKPLYKPLYDLRERISQNKESNVDIDSLLLLERDSIAYYSMYFRFSREAERTRRVSVGLIFDLTADGLILLGFSEMP